MKRIQIMLHYWQADYITKLSKKTGISKCRLVRTMIDFNILKGKSLKLSKKEYDDINYKARKTVESK